MKSSKIKTITGRILFFIAVCFIFIMPILSLLRMSLTTDGGFGLQNYVDMLHEERTAKAVRNTLIISIASTVIAVAAGSFFAFLPCLYECKEKETLRVSGPRAVYHPVLHYHTVLEQPSGDVRSDRLHCILRVQPGGSREEKG